MYIGNNFITLLCIANISLTSARDYANRLFGMSDTKSVELLKRQRCGYVTVKIVRHHEGAQYWQVK